MISRKALLIISLSLTVLLRINLYIIIFILSSLIFYKKIIIFK